MTAQHQVRGANTTVIDGQLAGKADKASLPYDVRQSGVVGDGVTDDSAALIAAVALCSGANKRVLYVPAELNVRVNSQINMQLVRRVDCQGTITVGYTGGPGVIFGDTSSGRNSAVYYFKRVVWAGAQSNVALRAVGLKNSRVTVDYCDYLQLYADAAVATQTSIAYSDFHLGRVLKLELLGAPGTSWINENNFYGGSVDNLIIDADSYAHNANTFHGVSVEGAASTIQILKGSCNRIETRGEGGTLVTFGTGTWANQVIGHYVSSPGVHSTPMIIASDGGTENVLMSSHDEKFSLLELLKIDSQSVMFNGSSEWTTLDASVPVPGFDKLRTRTAFGAVIDTGIIPIRGTFAIDGGTNYYRNWALNRLMFDSDVTLWRPRIYAYDSAGVAIDPTVTPWMLTTGGWTANAGGYYTFGANQQFAQMTLTSATVASIRITVTPSGSAGDAFGWVRLLGYVIAPQPDTAIQQVRRAFRRPLYQAAAPTQGLAKPGETVEGSTAGYSCVSRVDTTLSVGASISATSITVTSATGIANGDVIGVLMDTGQTHWTTVSGAPAGNVVTLAVGLTAAAASGKTVGTNRWASTAKNDAVAVFDVTAHPFNADKTGVAAADTAIAAAITAAGATGTVHFPAGTYKTTTTTTFVSSVSASADAVISYTGTGAAIQVGSGTSGVILDRKRIQLPQAVLASEPATGWTAGTIGVHVINLYRSELLLTRIRGFETGLYLFGKGHGTSYVLCHPGHLDNNKVNQRLSADATGWCNQLTFIGGAWSHDSNEGANVAGTRHILLDDISPNSDPNNNTWYTPSLESPGVVEYTIDVQGGSYNTWHNPRFEFTGGNSKIRWGAGAVRNRIEGGNQVDSIVETHVSGATNNSWIGSSTGRQITSLTQGIVLENSGSSSSAVDTVMRAGGTGLGDDPATAYTWRRQSNLLRGKRYNDAFDRVAIDPVNGTVALGDGTATPVVRLDASGATGAVVAKTAAYTATAADSVITADATGGAFSITLPTAVGIAGKSYTVKRINGGSNAVTVATTSSQTIDGGVSRTLSTQWESLTVTSNGANWVGVGPRPGMVNVKDFGALGNNTGNDATAIQAAIDSLPTTGSFVGGTVYLPVGIYRLTSPITLKSYVRLVGDGQRATRISVASGTGLFTWTATLSKVNIENLYLSGASGHLFAPTGDFGIHSTTVQNCTIVQSDTASSIMHYVGSSDYDNVHFLTCDLQRASGATVPGFNIINSGGAANENRWENCWAHSNGSSSAPFFKIESTSADNYAYNNVFRQITGEQNLGGLIHLFNAFGSVIDSVTDYDATTYTADLFKIGSSPSAPALRSRYVTISNSGRRGGTLTGGVYDINLVPGSSARCTLISPNHSSEPTSGLRINMSESDAHTLIGVPPQGTVWATQPTGVAHFFGSAAKFGQGVLVPVSAKTSAYTLTSFDEVVTADATTAPFTITLPTAVGIAGRSYTIKRINAGANAVTVATTSAQTIDGASTYLLNTQYASVEVTSDGAGWVVASDSGITQPRVASTTSSATPTPTIDTASVYGVTALAVGATFGAPTGTPADGQSLLIRIKDNGSPQTLAWNAIYRAIGTTLPTTTVAGKQLYVGARYNANATKWDVLAVGVEA